MRDQWMRDGKGFLLVYAINDHSSFEEMESFRENIFRCQDSEDVPIVLVGNKCDLEEERKVTYEEASGVAKEWGCPFLETSAKSGINGKKMRRIGSLCFLLSDHLHTHSFLWPTRLGTIFYVRRQRVLLRSGSRNQETAPTCKSNKGKIEMVQMFYSLNST